MKRRLFYLLGLIVLLFYAAWLLLIDFHAWTAGGLTLVGVKLLIGLAENRVELLQKRDEFLTRLLNENAPCLTDEDKALLEELSSKHLL